MDELWRIAAEDQADAAGKDAKAACITIAAVARALLEAFLEAGFDRDEAFGLLMVMWEQGAVADA